MLTVLSPAKTLDYQTPSIVETATVPRFMDQSALLVDDARALAPDDIRALMGVSENIAHLNHERFMNWESTAT
ncbi:YaaA family protein, partial [Luminiphilus sp.]|nr:YaaA family protein [Luminiphilus sp.]